ncbi:MAG: FkbM family methyltransferase [Spirochaetales bacterium]
MKSIRNSITRTGGILRSFAMYYGIPFRGARLRRFYRRFVVPGGLCFDIGANVGNRTRAFSALGARVISVEPQPHFAAILRRLFERDTRVTVLETAVGDSCGSVTLHLNERHPTLATTRSDWIAALRAGDRFAREKWNTAVEVPQRTLEDLAEEFGEPDFTKIDVEGNESGVLAGLKRALPALSFEFLPETPELARDCVRILGSLGDYRYNYAFGEQLRFVEATWLSHDELLERLAGIPDTGESGDIYAVRADVLSDVPL